MKEPRFVVSIFCYANLLPPTGREYFREAVTGDKLLGTSLLSKVVESKVTPRPLHLFEGQVRDLVRDERWGQSDVGPDERLAGE
jgi:hypothetical protein